MTPAVKYWVCKTAPPFVAEAMECLGGNGYVEDGVFARLYREVPVNSIWEGSGNIMALDVVRVLKREPECALLVLAEINKIAGGDRHIKSAVERWTKLLDEPDRIRSARADDDRRFGFARSGGTSARPCAGNHSGRLHRVAAW